MNRMVKTLITGKGTSGSWQIRGVQLGEAMGATVMPMASLEAIRAHDVVIVVKRCPDVLLSRIRKAKKPWIWDAVDAWPQPAGNGWSEADAKAWLHSELRWLRPSACVGATSVMTEDIRERGFPATWIRHHARPGQKINPIRDDVATIGYEGSAAHLGVWATRIANVARKMNIKWVSAPSQLADIDIVVALREQRGYSAMNWKSNVKLANAQGSGTPIILGDEFGYLETMCGAEIVINDASEIGPAIERLRPRGQRLTIQHQLLEAARSVKFCAMLMTEFATEVWKTS